MYILYYKTKINMKHTTILISKNASHISVTKSYEYDFFLHKELSVLNEEDILLNSFIEYSLFFKTTYNSGVAAY